MGILNFWKPKEVPVPPGAGVGYGEFSTPRGKVPIIPSTGKGTGIDGWAPKLGVTLPTVPNQDALLIHYDLEKPTDPGHPSRFWTNRNAQRLAYGAQEKLQAGSNETGSNGGYQGGDGTTAWDTASPREIIADDPKRTPVPNSRPTMTQSPSNYRFTAPMHAGRGDTPHLNGWHFSMADIHRSYPIRGMRPSQRLRNTFRLEPPPRDAQSMDVPATLPTVPAQEYVTPVSNSAPGGRTFRL